MSVFDEKRYRKPFEDAMGLFKVKYITKMIQHAYKLKNIIGSGYLTHFILKLENASFYLDDHQEIIGNFFENCIIFNFFKYIAFKLYFIVVFTYL